MAPDKETIKHWFQGLQNDICRSIEAEDGLGTFVSDSWQRPGGGGGDSRVIENGAVIEKGGVNFSAVFGTLPQNVAKALNVNTNEFFATGVSIVMHPQSPMVPIIHMNVRYFELNEDTWWFGGGIDLTPHYFNEEQCLWFHDQLKAACDKHNSEYHQRFSKWANEYFYIKHRKESRGVSGIFFDRLNSESEHRAKADLFAFVQHIGQTFAPTYTHLMALNKNIAYGELQKAWQMHRRSRYVEFNLVYDKGTKFGLDTDGRVDSILMSLPPSTGWKYSQTWPKGGEEERTQTVMKTRFVP